MNLKKSLVLFVFLSFIPHLSGAKNYYVAKNGSDRNPGLKHLPFRTIQAAARRMEAGDTCFIRQGVYRETVMLARDGRKLTPVVFIRYGKDPVIITGADKVHAWIPWKNGIWKAYVPDRVLQLTVHGKLANLARYPDKQGDNMLTVSDWAEVSASADGKVVFNGPPQSNGYWQAGICHFLTGKHWIAHIEKIERSQGNEVFCNNKASWVSLNSGVYLGKGVGCIYHLHALDHPGEWFWQQDTLYYLPRQGEDLTNMDVEARIRTGGFVIRNRKNIEVRGLDFIMATVDMEGAENCTLEGCNIFYPEPFFFYHSGWCRDQGGGKDYSIVHWEGKGVVVSGKYNVIRNCYVGHSWGDGISIGGTCNKIENCLVEDCDWSATDAAAISVTGYGHTIIRCTLRNTARSVLLNRFAGKTDILYNDLGDAGRMCEDLGITYSYHTNGAGSQIAYNRVHDNHAKSTASGIYLDNYDTAYVVHHNVVWNVAYAIQTNKPAVHHRIYNNTVWHCDHAMHAWGREGTEVEDQIVANNLADKPWDVGTEFHKNLVTNNPGFKNPQNGDFTLRKDSPAIDYGIVVPGITDGYRGKVPDAGAYEFGVLPWKAGCDMRRPDIQGIIKSINFTADY